MSFSTRWAALPVARALAASTAAGLLLLQSPDAVAYTLESAVGEACHESLATAALAAARARVPTAPVIPPSQEEQALIDDVPFPIASSSDVALVALLIGARDNDLKGSGAQELDSLATVHGDPALQREHCLRHPDHDGEAGSAQALDACRGFITEQFDAALLALDESGVPDPAVRTTVAVTLAIRGEIDVSLPTFWVEIGRAVHAMQDGFTHTYRTPDAMRVTAVVNWVDVVEKDYDEARDGPPHSMELDRCDDPDELRRLRRELATTASADLLVAALRPGASTADKRQELASVLERYLSFEPGCHAGNDWCDAPERAYADDTGCACRVGPGAAGGAGASLAWLATAAVAVLRRRRRGGRALRRFAPPIAGLLALAAVAGEARAQSPDAAATETQVEPTLTETDERPWDPALGIQGTFAGAYDNLALAGSLGAHYRLTQDWIVALTAEYNPFMSLNGETFRRGVFNGYATLRRRWPMRYEPVSLKTAVHAGTSVLLMDLVGAPAGSVGVFIGATPLGLEWRVTRSVNLLLDPIALALPVPQWTGVPFAYGQYRTTIGAEILVL